MAKVTGAVAAAGELGGQLEAGGGTELVAGGGFVVTGVSTGGRERNSIQPAKAMTARHTTRHKGIHAYLKAGCVAVAHAGGLFAFLDSLQIFEDVPHVRITVAQFAGHGFFGDGHQARGRRRDSGW